MPTFSLWDVGACNCTGTGAVCSPCNIPQFNLTLSYTNVLYGNGTATLVYGFPPSRWISRCSNGLTYELLCTSGTIELRVIYYTAGSCPTGTAQYCSNL